MKCIYLLEHYHVVDVMNDEEIIDRKLIGYYSSLNLVECKIEEYKKIQGFQDYPDGFTINKIQIDYAISHDDTIKIYDLWHEYESSEKHCDIVTHIAVFSTREKAQKTLKKIKKYTKLINYADGFTIDEYFVNRDQWKEGFVPNKD